MPSVGTGPCQRWLQVGGRCAQLSPSGRQHLVTSLLLGRSRTQGPAGLAQRVGPCGPGGPDPPPDRGAVAGLPPLALAAALCGPCGPARQRAPLTCGWALGLRPQDAVLGHSAQAGDAGCCEGRSRELPALRPPALAVAPGGLAGGLDMDLATEALHLLTCTEVRPGRGHPQDSWLARAGVVSGQARTGVWGAASPGPWGPAYSCTPGGPPSPVWAAALASGPTRRAVGPRTGRDCADADRERPRRRPYRAWRPVPSAGPGLRGLRPPPPAAPRWPCLGRGSRLAWLERAGQGSGGSGDQGLLPMLGGPVSCSLARAVGAGPRLPGGPRTGIQCAQPNGPAPCTEEALCLGLREAPGPGKGSSHVLLRGARRGLEAGRAALHWAAPAGQDAQGPQVGPGQPGRPRPPCWLCRARGALPGGCAFFSALAGIRARACALPVPLPARPGRRACAGGSATPVRLCRAVGVRAGASVSARGPRLSGRERARRNARGLRAAGPRAGGPARPWGGGAGPGAGPSSAGDLAFTCGGRRENETIKAGGGAPGPEWLPRRAGRVLGSRPPRRAEPRASARLGPAVRSSRATPLGPPAMEAPRGRCGLAALWCLGLLGALARVAGTHYRYLWRGCYPCHLGQAGYPVSAGDRRPGGRWAGLAGGGTCRRSL
ncbi:hypothetical protein J0S82_016208 [Galemys pyrenaicus]|uniref:Uncharacterized protein n=1 Tax=Galemys pyrenaicus TaxID=202257 RepID=A0A8J6DEC2_GALPY|nr:hypothetical protein J0S82_016208 [Galemys pyrenaicus]